MEDPWWCLHSSERKALVDFCLSEFSLKKTITWSCRIDKITSPELTQYDITIGDDLIQELDIPLLYSKQVMTWKLERQQSGNDAMMWFTKRN
jgi:hypothetical protein